MRFPGVAGIANEDTDLAALAEHMNAHGMADPLITTPDPDSGMLIIIDGASRFMAAQRLAWREIDVINLPMPDVLRAAAEAVHNPSHPEYVTRKRASHRLRLGLGLAQLWAPWMHKRRIQLASRGGTMRGKSNGIRTRGNDSEAALLRLRILDDMSRSQWARLYQLRGAFQDNVETIVRNGMALKHDAQMAREALARIDAGEGFNRIVEEYLSSLNPHYMTATEVRKQRRTKGIIDQIVVPAAQWRRQMSPTLGSVTQLVQAAEQLGLPSADVPLDEVQDALSQARAITHAMQGVVRRLSGLVNTRINEE